MKAYAPVAMAILVALSMALPAIAQAYDCPWRSGANATTVDDATRQQYLDESKELRRKMAGDRSALEAVLSSAAPDPEQARALRESIFDAHQELRAMAQKHGVAMGGGCGSGKGHGWRHGSNSGCGYGDKGGCCGSKGGCGS